MILIFCGLIASLATNVVMVFLFTKAISSLNKLHYEEKSELFNRFMSGDYKTYRYFKDDHPVVVDNMKKTLEKERQRVKTDLELEKEEMARGF